MERERQNHETESAISTLPINQIRISEIPVPIVNIPKYQITALEDVIPGVVRQVKSADSPPSHSKQISQRPEQSRGTVVFSATVSPRDAQNETELDIYLREIRRYPILDKIQEQTLFEALRNGRPIEELTEGFVANTKEEERDKMAAVFAESQSLLDVVLKCNLRLVVAEVRKHLFLQSPDALDLIQEGNSGLRRAAERYDPSGGARFGTYARYSIRQAIHEAKTSKLPEFGAKLLLS